MIAAQLMPEAAKWRETLDRMLGVEMLALLQDAAVTDLHVNPDGRVFVERRGAETAETTLRFEPFQTLSLVRSVAKLVGAEAHERKPVLETRLPYYGLRFEGLLPPVVDAPCCSMRKPAGWVYPLASYVESGRMSNHALGIVLEAVQARKNLLIAGGTGSGKTSFGMAVGRAIGETTPDDRVFLIEDTRELDAGLRDHVRNFVATQSSDVASMEQLLVAALRMAPTRIFVGEVRDASALTLLEAWNTGHSGGLCTVHANSARDALRRLAHLAAKGTQGYVPRDDVARAVELVVFVTRRNGERGVVDHIVRVEGLDDAGEFVCEEIYDARTC